MENLTIKIKRKILARFIECQVTEGYMIDWIFAKPLNWFDYKKLIALIHKTETDYMEYPNAELFNYKEYL